MSNIWIVCQDAVTPNFPGGTRHYDFGAEWVRSGHRVSIFAATVHLTTYSGCPNSKETRAGHEWVDGVEFTWVPTIRYKGNNWRRVLNMVLFALNTVLHGWKRRAEKPDIIIGSSPNLFAAFGAYWLARLLGSPFVLEVRDLWPQSLIDLGVSPRHPLVLLFGWMEQFLYTKAQRIIVLARGSVSYISDRGIARSKISYVPNGVHLDHFTASTTRKEGRFKYGFKKFTLGYVGVCGESHGLVHLIDAMSAIDDPNIELVIIGNGPARPNLIEYVRDKAITNVRFTDPVPKTEIPLILNALDVGVLSLRQADCFRYGISPNKLFDYMAAELPVLAIVDGWVAELVVSSGCGTVCIQEDVKSISSGIYRLADKTPDKLSQMGQRGRKVIQEQFNRKTWAAEYLRIIFCKSVPPNG